MTEHLDDETRRLLLDAQDRAARYLEDLPHRRVFPSPDDVAGLARLGGALPEHGEPPADILARLDEAGSPGTVASAGGRYFGFVTGAALPASVAAGWLAGAWDQNAFTRVSSPVGAALERIVLDWLADLLGLRGGRDDDLAGSLVTGATMANFTALAAARHAVLARTGFDVEARGLGEAPPVTVVAGEEVHVSLLKAVTLLGLGRERVVRVPADDQGRMRADAFRETAADLDGAPAIVCIQAGNVNSGAFDPAAEICAAAHDAGAWVHTDGAFGLWAAACPPRAHLAAGFADADSWALDAHKWLNVPYDCGVVFVRDGAALRASMGVSASYLPERNTHDPYEHTPEASRRLRAADVWAALRYLGGRGLADLVDRCCRHAGRFAEGLRASAPVTGAEVRNDVVLNQVVVSFGSDERTRRVIAAVQEDGTCWAGGTEWKGRTSMRISVSSWTTTDEDVERSLEAIVRAASGAPE